MLVGGTLTACSCGLDFALGYLGNYKGRPCQSVHSWSGRAFDPETIDVMSEALKGVCETLSLKLVDGPERVLWPRTTHPMLAQRYDLLRDKARGRVVYDLQAQGPTHAL